MDIELLFPISYPKPLSLSGLYLCDDAEDIEAILSKLPSSLDNKDFRSLFRIVSPGSYREIVYFLPEVLLLIQRDFSLDTELAEGIVYFISSNSEQLHGDHLLSPAIFILEQTFHRFTAIFDIQSLDAEESLRRGIRRTPFCWVNNSREIAHFLASFRRHGALDYVGDLFFESLAFGNEKYSCSAWFLEFALQLSRRQIVVSERMQLLLTNGRLLNSHFSVVRRSSEYDLHSIYWVTLYRELFE